MSARPQARLSKEPDPWSLYHQMLRSRLFEAAVSKLWEQGRISGEMHLGTGEEGIVAGVLAHLEEGDAMALDHRGTPPMVMRGVDLRALLREMLGRPDGLCRGMGGHMHLFSPEHLAASSGIVGASGPAAAGFALASRHLRPGTVAVSFFGEGAMNQGMLLESLNLAAVWELPVLFVCKDNSWAITTRSPKVTAGGLLDRARAFGLRAASAVGWRVEDVWETAGRALRRVRAGEGPEFLLASCVHLEGHFLGDAMLRVVRRPLREMGRVAGPLGRSVMSSSGSPGSRKLAGLASMAGSLARSAFDDHKTRRDPVRRSRRRLARLDSERLDGLDRQVGEEIARALAEGSADSEAGGREGGP